MQLHFTQTDRQTDWQIETSFIYPWATGAYSLRAELKYLAKDSVTDLQLASLHVNNFYHLKFTISSICINSGHEYCKQGILAQNTISTISSEDPGVNSPDVCFFMHKRGWQKELKKSDINNHGIVYCYGDIKCVLMCYSPECS